MVIKARGKINLSLDITGRRENGYHDIASLMQSVILCDEVEITKKDMGEISVKTDCLSLPDGEDNIAYKACQQMVSDYNLQSGFDVVIRKKIPIAGGMAGGSTDAAAVIRGINELCELGLSREKLMETGVKIGADVPFCIQENPALATGIGEVLTPVSGLPQDIWILLVNPKVQVSTKAIYEAIDEKAQYGSVNNEALISALKAGDVALAKDYMINVMEPVTGALCRQVPEIIEKLKDMGALHAMMSGSGATCFGLFTEKPDEELAKRLFPEFYVCVTKPYVSDC